LNGNPGTALFGVIGGVFRLLLDRSPRCGYLLASMSSRRPETKWNLPYSSPLPEDIRKRKSAKLLRAAAYLAAAAALIAPVVLFQASLHKRIRSAKEFDRLAASGAIPPGKKRPEATKGALARWRQATYQFWSGRNIYALPEQPPAPAAAPAKASETTEDDEAVYLHPNMPFTVMLLSPLAYMSLPAEMLTFNLLKLAVIVASCLMAARVAGHQGRRIPDWVLGLGLLWAIRLIVGDLQHANTNCLVLGAVVFHLWLYRRGRNYLAGIPLAAAICIKLTPALFVAYWLYQRNWKLAAGTAAAGLLMTVLIPIGALGPQRYGELTGSWLRNVIAPGLVRNAWFPTHVNQSLNGVAARYLLTGRDGNMTWDPDNDPYYVKTPEGWITLVALPESVVRMIVRAAQFLIVGVAAWAIGWRRLPRDDGRRALHYGLVLLGMMLLNQRTWDHHAAVMLIAPVAVWHAIALGKMPRKAKAWVARLTVAAGCCVLLKGNELFQVAARLSGKSRAVGEHWGNVFEAFGPTFYHFVFLFAAAVILAVALRRREEPFAGP
jgi:hypothetical protein